MKNHFQLSLLSAMAITLGLAQANAAQTNVVQHIAFQLVSLEQGPTNHPSANLTVATVTKARLTTKDIIAALGTATTNTFSTKARLVRVKDINATDDTSTIQIRDGSNTVVDVTAFFPTFGADDKARSFQYHSKTDLDTGSRYGIFYANLTNSAPYNLIGSLKLSGVAATAFAYITAGGVEVGVDEIDASLSGEGLNFVTGAPAVYYGQLTVLGHSTEVK